jgi:uncharacterized small protein (DUF1192 family)
MATAFMVGGTGITGFLWLASGCRVRTQPRPVATMTEDKGLRQGQMPAWDMNAVLALSGPCRPPPDGSESHMDWDDDRLKPKRFASTITVGEPLGNLSIAELEARIAALTREIERVREEMRAKQVHEAAAAALFTGKDE